MTGHFTGHIWLFYIFKFPNRRFLNFYNSFFITICFFFFFQSSKNISAINEAIILIFAVNLPMAFIYKFCNFNPTTRRTSRTSSRWSSTKKVRAKQNFIKDNIAGRMILILWRIIKKSAKKLKIKSPEKHSCWKITLKLMNPGFYTHIYPCI